MPPNRLAYRTALRSAHPDKGGTKERFNSVQQAYAVLSDPAARSAYDNQQATRSVGVPAMTTDKKQCPPPTKTTISKATLIKQARTQADEILAQSSAQEDVDTAIHTLRRWLAVASTTVDDTADHRALLMQLLMQRSCACMPHNPEQALVDCEDAKDAMSLDNHTDAHNQHAGHVLAAVLAKNTLALQKTNKTN